MSVLAFVHCTGFRKLKFHRVGPLAKPLPLGLHESLLYICTSRAGFSVGAIMGAGGCAVRQPEQVQAQCLSGLEVVQVFILVVL